MSESPGFFGRLRRLAAFRAGVAYLLVAYVAIQVIATIEPVYGVPTWVVQWVTIAAIAGFPLVVLLASMYEKSKWYKPSIANGISQPDKRKPVVFISSTLR